MTPPLMYDTTVFNITKVNMLHVYSSFVVCLNPFLGVERSLLDIR